jgi:hypothetical protein
MKSKIFIIAVLITNSYLFSQRDIKILSSDFNSLTIEYSPIYTDTSTQELEGNFYKNVDLYLGRLSDSNGWGLPYVLERNLRIGVPTEFGNTIEILNTVYKEFAGKLKPIPFPVPDSISYYLEFKTTPQYYSYQQEEEVIKFGEFGLVRDVGTQTIILKPIKYDPNRNLIRLYTKIIFKINFAPNGKISQKPAVDLIDGLLINYNVAKYWNNSTVKNRLQKTTVFNSVLATGKWYRFEASDEGIYKITKSQLGSFGIDANNVDPRTIKIYNNGGKTVPENNSLPRPNDLQENAILVVGQEDGKFDDADYILFYGRGTRFWDYGSNATTIERFNHPYSTKNYFWITSGGTNGKRMIDKPSLSTTPTFTQTTTEAFADWEEDKINLGKTGRQFMGDNFNTSVPSRTYTNTLNWRVTSFPINYFVRFIVGSKTGLTLQIKENGNQLLSRVLNGYDKTKYVVGFQYQNSLQFTDSLIDNRSLLNFTISNADVASAGYLDYFTIKYEKYLKAVSDNIIIFSEETTGIREYKTSEFSSSNISVYDITDYSNVQKVSNLILNGSECKFQFDELSTARKKYILVGNNGFKSPINQVEISNSNLHGEEIGAKFIIVTHKNFLEAANSLKLYRETQAPVTISTYVVDVDQIYNEFSGGVMDPGAVRDYLKFAYDNWQIEPEYVLFFGKGTYDYKNIEGYGDNFVPTWQTVESLIFVYQADSYSTDDFFGRISGSDNVVDVASGRITCSNLDAANAFVNKIKDYELNQVKGDWRNLITLISDDGWKGTSYEGNWHTTPSENLANTYFPKSFDFKKIYSADYPDQITGQGKRKPLVNEAIINSMNEGTLFLNYFGHGSPELWADEYIFEKSVAVPQIINDKYFFLGAATCDFGYFDIPNYVSAAEDITFLANSGAIASFTAARLVFAGENEGLMYDLVTKLFNSGRDTLNLGIPIGKASMQSKSTSVNDQKYHILGDPTLRLLVPQYPAQIDSVNGQSLIADVQIKALSKARIVGTILKSDHTVWNDFNGEAMLRVYDSERRKLIESINYYVNMPGGVLFNGRVSIVNGKFAAEFVVPKDISYENKNGKVVLYFFNESVDGLGYTNRVLVGGSDSSIVNDGKGPDIEIYFDDVSNVNGTLVNKDSKLIVNLADETGINTTGTGVGHKLEGILNQQIQNPIDFTNYFSGDLDAGGKSGKINYQFTKLENGDNHLMVKAWDVFNNFSEDDVYFTVVDGSDLSIIDVYNYPNPFNDKTQFTFQQNLDKPIDVKIKVYSIAGRLIKEIEKQNITDRFVVIDWDGKDNDGDEISNGTYLYKVIVKSVDGEFNKSVLGKLAVLN